MGYKRDTPLGPWSMLARWPAAAMWFLLLLGFVVSLRQGSLAQWRAQAGPNRPRGPPLGAHGVAVKCEPHQVVVTVPRDLFGLGRPVAPAELTLGVTPCPPSAFDPGAKVVVFEAGLHQCGSTVQVPLGLGDTLQLQADVHTGNHLSLRIFVDSCMAGPSPESTSAAQYAIVDSHGCLVDGRQDSVSSTFLSPRPRPESLQFTVDAFRFAGDPRNLIYIACRLKVTPAEQAPDELNKACSFNPEANRCVAPKISKEFLPVSKPKGTQFPFKEPEGSIRVSEEEQEVEPALPWEEKERIALEFKAKVVSRPFEEVLPSNTPGKIPKEAVNMAAKGEISNLCLPFATELGAENASQ
ncbi:hypothetical protein JD844_000791 [Phrynosoma platyrhinos]|uniref:Zona pellucida sperm-binding protein 3 n=1 Tax=Phrynosoma platyrhinos TaxID=52577 RepID=A0ABQ7T9E8_PHRPL|nr:hypothetical protein JD844_000791 [Phrynosoma platyrhinos]